MTTAQAHADMDEVGTYAGQHLDAIKHPTTFKRGLPVLHLGTVSAANADTAEVRAAIRERAFTVVSNEILDTIKYLMSLGDLQGAVPDWSDMGKPRGMVETQTTLLDVIYDATGPRGDSVIRGHLRLMLTDPTRANPDAMAQALGMWWVNKNAVQVAEARGWKLAQQDAADARVDSGRAAIEAREVEGFAK